MIMTIPYILTTFLKRVAFPGGRKPSDDPNDWCAETLRAKNSRDTRDYTTILQIQAFPPSLFSFAS